MKTGINPNEREYFVVSCHHARWEAAFCPVRDSQDIQISSDRAGVVYVVPMSMREVI